MASASLIAEYSGFVTIIAMSEPAEAIVTPSSIPEGASIKI